jgi:hypothetical protein
MDGELVYTRDAPGARLGAVGLSGAGLDEAVEALGPRLEVV